MPGVGDGGDTEPIIEPPGLAHPEPSSVLISTCANRSGRVPLHSPTSSAPYQVRYPTTRYSSIANTDPQRPWPSSRTIFGQYQGSPQYRSWTIASARSEYRSFVPPTGPRNWITRALNTALSRYLGSAFWTGTPLEQEQARAAGAVAARQPKTKARMRVLGKGNFSLLDTT
jgi:hypothetical protein